MTPFLHDDPDRVILVLASTDDLGQASLEFLGMQLDVGRLAASSFALIDVTKLISLAQCLLQRGVIKPFAQCYILLISSLDWSDKVAH